MMRTSGSSSAAHRAEPAKTWDESRVVSKSAPSQKMSESYLVYDVWPGMETSPHGGYYDPLDAVFSPPTGIGSLQNIASESDHPTIRSPALQAILHSPPLSSPSPPSEMDICCSSFLPPYTTILSAPYDNALPTNVTADKSTSTPCTVAYALLTALNSRRHQQQDMFLITLELLNGFRIAPEGDPEGCRVDNNILVPVMGKLLAG